MEELRRTNLAAANSVIFDGFFNKIKERFVSEYAVQLQAVVVDEDIDQSGLKVFLEEAMASPALASATIEAVFN